MGGTGRFLLVGWDGGGNWAPLVGLGRKLRQLGHEVALVGPEWKRPHVEAAGCLFTPFRCATHPDPLGDPIEESIVDWLEFFCGSATASDVLMLLEAQHTDCLVVDCMLPAALGAADKSGLAYAALLHLRYEFFTEGPASALWDLARPALSSTRRALGISELSEDRPVMAQLWERPAVALAALPEVLDHPRTTTPANLRHVGPIFDDTALDGDRIWTPKEAPVVLVSFSTTNMGQGPVLQHVLDALSDLDARVLCTTGRMDVTGLRIPTNAEVFSWLPHQTVLPHASAVVTHAGMSTIQAALAHGVPLVCMPMGRDQDGNAERVSDLGAGRTVACSSPLELVREAVLDIYSSASYRRAAVQLADAISGYNEGAQAVDVLESLLISPFGGP